MAVTMDNYNLDSFYINGKWQQAKSTRSTLDLINPANTDTIGRLALGNAEDVDNAVMAAKSAFTMFQATSKAQRLDYLEKILTGYKSRYDDFAEAIRLEMGALLRCLVRCRPIPELSTLSRPLPPLKRLI